MTLWTIVTLLSVIHDDDIILSLFVMPTPILSDPGAGLPRQYQVLFRLVPTIRIKHAYSATLTQPTKHFVVTTHMPFTNWELNGRDVFDSNGQDQV